MISKKEVEQLAYLSRLELSSAELESLSRDLDSIVEYVSHLPDVEEGAFGDDYVRNEFREDGDPHEKGAYTERLLNEAPSRDEDYVSVNKVISPDNG